jgi:hypothetical protein
MTELDRQANKFMLQKEDKSWETKGFHIFPPALDVYDVETLTLFRVYKQEDLARAMHQPVL